MSKRRSSCGLDDIHTIEALPIVLESLKSKGHTFVKMNDMIKQSRSGN
ncbi:hypothetical protein [Brevibacillus sp. IT-7CA2]